MVIALLGFACTTLVSCDSGNTTKTEVVYDGPDTTYINDGLLFFLQNTPDSIVVKSGDNLWDLSMVKWGNNEWYRFMSLNPFLNNPGRVKYEGGKIIVLIYPGEKLDFSGINNVPVPTRLKETVVTVTEKDKGEILGLVWWKWLIFLFLAYVLTKALLDDARAYGNKNKKPEDPVNAGPRIWPNGVTPENSQARFEEIARSRGYSNYRIENKRRGVLNGKGRVYFADGTSKIFTLKNQSAYYGEIVKEDGTRESVHYLEGCANDVRRGTRYKGFTFTPDTEQPAAMTQQPVIDLRKQTTDQPVTKETQPEAKIQEKIENKKEEKESEKSAAAAALENVKALIAEIKENGGEIEDFETNVGGKTLIKFKKLTINKKEEPKKEQVEGSVADKS